MQCQWNTTANVTNRWKNCLSADDGGNRFVTIEEYRRETGLSYKTSKKCLDMMTEGDNPILRKTRIGHTNVYTEV